MLGYAPLDEGRLQLGVAKFPLFFLGRGAVLGHMPRMREDRWGPLRMTGPPLDEGGPLGASLR